ncbi:hypothetical protein [Microbacterium sp. SORGH_AS_0888]|uniref:hypothetical protein n=1 Tax=Microbacterium sp. SORGH_AS_0888 TaxID=3041791 RepID=UPI00278B90C2|nr:hypothetical protein [Microbacterium sp. SORGH_AS_0888]MDQ1129715.1 hypothetical protein [Microbacterium sp. SORGH_AS_0888]
MTLTFDPDRHAETLARQPGRMGHVVSAMNTRILIPASLALALLLTACSPHSDPTPKEPDVTSEQVKAQITDLYEASAAIAPDGWKVDDASWSACSDDSSGPRVKLMFAASRTAPLPGTPADLIAQAQKAWQERGHDVSIERDTNLTPPRWILSDPPYLTGTHSDGSYYLLDVNESAIYFEAYSACVPGDIFQLTTPTPTQTP